MPVDRQTFEAVRQRVIETAPAGLSREQFDALLDQEVAKAEPAQPQQPTDSRSRIMGRLDQMEARGRELRQEAVEHPVGTAANIALAAAAPVAGRVAAQAAKAAKPWVWPTREAAGQKFQQVMGAAKNAPVDISGPGNVALRIQELADRGSSMPMVARRFLQRVTDPNKGALTYEEARDFASNVSRLSANEFGRLTPKMATEVHKLRVALNKAIGDTAASAGKGPEYWSAMKEYARAAQRAELGRAAAKKGLQAAGLTGTAYLVGKALGIDPP